MIALRDVTIKLPANASNPRTVLDRVSLEIDGGQWVALVGPNGSGKTTMLHTIAGLIAPWSGEVACPPRRQIALLLQEPDNQFVAHSVRYELELSLPDGVPAAADGGRVERVVERFGLASLLERNPHRLSGGEKQRLALATVWLREPELLLLDEPTSYLDGEAASLCASFVEDAHARGVTVVWATPGGPELDRAGRVVCIDAGRVAYDGGVDALYEWVEESGFDFVRPPLRGLAEELAVRVPAGEHAARIARSAAEGAAGLARVVAPLVVRAAGSPSDAGACEGGARGGAEVVRFDAVGFGYGDVPAVAGVDFSVHEGECLGLAGPNGAGKSTVLGLAAGLYEPTVGSVTKRFDRVRDSGRQRVFYSFQNPERLFFAETVSEELNFGLERLGVASPEREERVRAALLEVGLTPESFLERVPVTLSPGEMRRVAFSIALSLEPEVLLLDEPTSCLDTAAISALSSILVSRRTGGQTTMLASHDASFLAGVCDRILWLRGGRIEAELATKDGCLPPGATWPGDLPPILELQERLADEGTDVTPRVLTADRLVERLL